MSVKVCDRKESTVQFIETARLLYNHTVRTCIKFPKRLMFFISWPLVKTATNFYTAVIKGNEINVKTKEDFLQRRQYFQEALGDLAVLEGQVNLAYNYFAAAIHSEKTFAPKAQEKWGKYILKERTLLNGLLKKEFEKYSELYNIENND